MYFRGKKMTNMIDISELKARIEKLEEWTHPPVAPGGTTELMELIDNLEKRIKELENNQ